MWPQSPEDIDAQIRQRKAAILDERDEQRQLQHRLEAACQDETDGRTAFDDANDRGDTAATVRALHVIDAAVCVKTRCRRLIDDHADAISRLQDEIAALPLPRWPVDP